MSLTPATEKNSADILVDPEVEVVDIFVRVAQMLGQPRSIGEIYGYLFISPEPRTMQQITDGLSMSKGSVSQGLRFLRSLGAVKLKLVSGSRSDHFVADSQLKVIADGFLRNEVEPHLSSGKDRLAQLKRALENQDDDDLLKERVAQLEKWHRRASRLLPLVRQILK